LLLGDRVGATLGDKVGALVGFIVGDGVGCPSRKSETISSPLRTPAQMENFPTDEEIIKESDMPRPGTPDFRREVFDRSPLMNSFIAASTGLNTTVT
jgi:hypothetical protein